MSELNNFLREIKNIFQKNILPLNSVVVLDVLKGQFMPLAEEEIL